jgi:hypothetical protein
MVELNHSCLNLRFDIDVTFTTNDFLVVGDVSIDSETLLMINFVNLKIKPIQFYKVECIYIYSDVLIMCF